MVEQMRENWGITGLTGRDEDHYRQAMAVDELVDLRRQAASGAAYGVVRRLGLRIRAIRLCPPVWRAVFVAC